MTTAEQNLQRTKRAGEIAIEDHSNHISPYLPEILQRLLLVYGLPFTTVLLTSTIGGILLSSFIPISTTNILIFALNIFILVRGWRWAENRWKATALFVSYTRFSSARRTLRTALNEDQSQPVIDDMIVTLNQSVEVFMGIVDAFNVQPYSEKNKR